MWEELNFLFSKIGRFERLRVRLLGKQKGKGEIDSTFKILKAGSDSGLGLGIESFLIILNQPLYAFRNKLLVPRSLASRKALEDSQKITKRTVWRWGKRYKENIPRTIQMRAF